MDSRLHRQDLLDSPSAPQGLVLWGDLSLVLLEDDVDRIVGEVRLTTSMLDQGRLSSLQSDTCSSILLGTAGGYTCGG